MSYRIYNGTQLLGDVNNKSTGINGLLPATSYQFGVSNYDGNRESSKTTINVKTRGIRLIIPTSLTVNSTITLHYQEYSLGLVPIGTEPAGMFGGGNKRNIQAKVISVDNGKSTVELLEPLESSSTVSVGGTNLLFKTKDIDINNKNWYQKGNNTYYDKKYDKKAIHSWGDYSTYVSNQTIHLEANTDYAVSAYLLSYQTGNGSGIQFGVYAKNTADNQAFTIGVLQNTKGNLSNTEWRRFSTVYHNTTAKDITDFRIEAFGDWSTVSGNIWIAEIKLEKGNIPTDWSPAPEDVRTATPMIGGGKNLARGTSDSWQGVGTQEFNGGTNFTKKVADVYLDDLNVGDKVTVQIIYQYSGVTSNNAQCWLQGAGDVTGWNGGNFYGGNNRVINMQTGTDVKHGSMKYTFTIDSDMKKNRYWSVAYRFDNVNKGAWFQWLKFKVEKGTVATPWSPAPEDTQYIVDNTQMNKLQDGSFAAFNGYRAIYFNQ